MIFARGLVLMVLMLAAISCTVPTTPMPTETLAPTRVPTPTMQSFVDVVVFGQDGKTAVNAPIGSQVVVVAAFRPSQRDDRTTIEWRNHTIAEMRYCVGGGCALPDQWQPFVDRIEMRVPVEWIGLRPYSLTAQFRDARGALIPAGYALSERATTTCQIIGIVDERTPIAAQPSAVQTSIARARADFPVTGKIQVGERPIAGGKAGSKLDIKVKFQASSPAGDVREMRIKLDSTGRCLTPDEMNNAPWEPFVAEKNYTTTIAINWQSFHAHVQYRDAAGNLSPVYCGEMAIEGMP